MKNKIIKIEIHEAPEGYVRRDIEMVKYPDINPASFNELDTVDYSQTSRVVKELYPLEGMALGNHREWFYIREKDKTAFEEMLKGFTAKARQIQLKAILEYGYKNPDEVWKFIVRLADSEGLAVHVNSHTKELVVEDKLEI